MPERVGALIRDAGGTLPSPLISTLQNYLGTSGTWALATSTGPPVLLAARLLRVDSAKVGPVFVAAYSDASGNTAIVLKGGVLAVGTDEVGTWATASILVQQLLPLGASISPIIERVSRRSAWDLVLPVFGTAGVFVASSTVFQNILPGGAVVWTTVALGIIVLSGLYNWKR